jgi:Flp pilus assembly pilin Flp
MNRLHLMWTEDDGVLSFEWTLLLTLLTIGIVSGLAGARDAIIDELGDVAEAAQAFNQSFFLAGVSLEFDPDNGVTPDFETPDMEFDEDADDQFFQDCGRTSPGPTAQPGLNDNNGGADSA